MRHTLFNHPLWLDVSNLALTRDATKNNHVLTSFCTCACVSLRSIPRSEVTGPEGICISDFNNIAKWHSLGVVPIYAFASSMREAVFGEGFGFTDEWSRDF